MIRAKKQDITTLTQEKQELPEQFATEKDLSALLMETLEDLENRYQGLEKDLTKANSPNEKDKKELGEAKNNHFTFECTNQQTAEETGDLCPTRQVKG